jgi:sarcosine oxidase gamma subunit
LPHLADRSGIGKLEVSGSALAIAELHPSGRSPRPGRVLEAAEAWWCVISPERMLVLSDGPAGSRVRDELGGRAGADARVVDVTADRVALCLTGPFGLELLIRAGVAPPLLGGLRVARVGEVEVVVIHEREEGWLLVAPASMRTELWRSLSEAGERFGLTEDAAERPRSAPIPAGA